MSLKKLISLLLMIVLFLFYVSQYAVFANFKDDEEEKVKDTKIILNEDEIEVFELINKYRKDNGLRKLKFSSELQEVAQIKAEDLLNSKEFSHNSQIYGSTFNIMKDKKISYKIAGENLAGNINSQRAVEAWINSETHRDNILDEYSYTAICVIESDVYGKIFVQLFM